MNENQLLAFCADQCFSARVIPEIAKILFQYVMGGKYYQHTIIYRAR